MGQAPASTAWIIVPQPGPHQFRSARLHPCPLLHPLPSLCPPLLRMSKEPEGGGQEAINPTFMGYKSLDADAEKDRWEEEEAQDDPESPFSASLIAALPSDGEEGDGERALTRKQRRFLKQKPGWYRTQSRNISKGAKRRQRELFPLYGLTHGHFQMLDFEGGFAHLRGPDRPPLRLVLEIGFGRGDALVEMARQHQVRRRLLADFLSVWSWLLKSFLVCVVPRACGRM
jgi:hypothetical protein